MKKLKIDPEFRDIIPPLSVDEFELLRNSLINEGCRDAIVTWNETIIDGHNRYQICMAEKIPFATKEMEFETRAEAKIWMIRNQFGRRNLTSFVRAELALELESTIKAMAKDSQIRKPLDSVCPNSDKQKKSIHTLEELAKASGVGRDSINKVRTVLREGDEDTKRQAREGTKSINDAYNTVRPLETRPKKCPICGKTKPLTEFHVGHGKCKECVAKFGSRATIQKVKELEATFPESEIETIYEEMKNPSLPMEADGLKCNRNPIISELFQTLKEFNNKIAKYKMVPQVKEDEELKALLTETVKNLNSLI